MKGRSCRKFRGTTLLPAVWQALICVTCISVRSYLPICRSKWKLRCEIRFASVPSELPQPMTPDLCRKNAALLCTICVFFFSVRILFLDPLCSILPQDFHLSRVNNSGALRYWLISAPMNSRYIQKYNHSITTTSVVRLPYSTDILLAYSR